ncbi:MAG: phosphopantetheine-binding protein [Romboutsia sp.]
MRAVKDVVIKCFEDVGIILDNTEEDVNLVEYGVDSLTIISIIVEIEERLSIHVSDEYLNLENFQSLRGFISMIESLVEE